MSTHNPTPRTAAGVDAESSTPAPDPLHLLRWHDPLIDQLGHDPRSRYVEQFWLGVLGPSTTLLLRHFADALDSGGGVAHVDLLDVAGQLGLGHRGGRNSPLARSIQRAIRFGAARPAGGPTLEVRHRLAPLNRAQVERLPHRLQSLHHTHQAPETSDRSAQSRARRLALSLLECGDGFDETERQLDQWRVPSTIAAEAVNWAWERHRHAANHHPGAA
ncbi:MAG: hypothetical protein AAGC53_04205 [Actinomycetota bacterium]